MAGGSAGRASAQGVTIDGRAITDEDAVFAAFGANLLLARLLPVEIRIQNDSENTIDLGSASWELASTSERGYERLAPKAALNRLYKYYGVRTYSKVQRKELEQRFAELGMDTTAPLPPAQHRGGLLFFAIPDSIDVHDRIANIRFAVTQIGFANRREKELKFEFQLREAP